MTENTSASNELLSLPPTNTTVESSTSIKASPGESVRSVNSSNPESFSSDNASTAESLKSFKDSTTESFSSVNLSSSECLRSFEAYNAESSNPSNFSTSKSPKPRTLSLANLPAGISVTSVAWDSMKITNVSEPKGQSNAFLSNMDHFVEEAAKENGNLKKMREESLKSISPSLAESTQSPKPKTLSINNLPPGVSVSSVSCDSLKPTKSQSDDFLSAMDKFVEEDAKEEGKRQKMREDMHDDPVLDKRASKADISFLASQVLKDVNPKLGMIANISISLASESTSASKNTVKRKRYNDSDDLSIFKDEDYNEAGNGKIKKIIDSDNLPKIKDADNIEIVNSEMSSC